MLVLIASMGIYELASRIRIVYGYVVIRQISIYSFALYLTHNIFIDIFSDRIKVLPMIKPLRLILLWSVSLAASFVASVLISKVPRIGKYILYMK